MDRAVVTSRLPRIGDDPRAVVTATDPATSAYLEGRNAARPRGAPALTWEQAERELLEVARESYCTRAGDQITTRYRSRRRAIDVELVVQVRQGARFTVVGASVRYDDGYQGSGREPGDFKIRAPGGGTLGRLRDADDEPRPDRGLDGIQFRRRGSEEWEPVPDDLDLVAMARASEDAGHPHMRTWLEARGVRVR